MISQKMTVHQNVIKKKYKPPKIWLANIIHQGLKSRSGIGQAKGHDQELIMLFMSPKGCLRNVIFPHSDLVVTRPQVQFREKKAPWSSSKNSSMTGIRYLSLIVS